ncbi:MAG: spondin domain-containing protein [Isosphaeraceae bacterium]
MAIALAIGLAFVARAASADQIRITVTNEQPGGGFAIAPVWIGLHNGSYTSFSAGDNLDGRPLQTVAELGSTAAITAAFAPFGPQTTVGGAPHLPGTSATSILDVASPSTTRFLNYAAMVVPSNDFFFGNDAAHTLTLFNASGQLIDANGQLTASRTIQIFGSGIWDAGTEVNNIAFGAAFIAGDNAADHVAEGGTVQSVFGGPADNSAYLNSISGRLTPAGYNISHLISPGDLIATIRISAVPEPSSIVLCGLGLLAPIGLALRARRRGPA